MSYSHHDHPHPHPKMFHPFRADGSYPQDHEQNLQEHWDHPHHDLYPVPQPPQPWHDFDPLSYGAYPQQYQGQRYPTPPPPVEHPHPHPPQQKQPQSQHQQQHHVHHPNPNPPIMPREGEGALNLATGMFYRTPEHPRLRTAQACEKCRTRKAKRRTPLLQTLCHPRPRMRVRKGGTRARA
ncbi:hypothetical protein FPV67DRAFT_1225875 [Lyophyllum atratum]|nr:hypothetical protein FPV67DRAFT_1225875 [Lyophyllum atratum]